MSRWYRTGLVAAVWFALLVWLIPAQASAYSYGDANTEDVAETFKVIAAEAGKDQPDWKTIEATHKARRSEIQSHFGETVAVTLDKNIEAKDSKLVVANYKAVLVMNLDRRFTYALKDSSDYAGSKLLLAKARATFDTLAPYMGGTDSIYTAFDEALEALGNPGLFGVGKKEPDPELFKQKLNYIYGKVEPLFPYKAYVKPAAEVKQEQPVKETDAAGKPAAGTSNQPAKPAASDKPKTASTNTTKVKEASSTVKSAASGSKPSAAAGVKENTPAKEAVAAPAETTEAEQKDAAAASETAVAAGAEGAAASEQETAATNGSETEKDASVTEQTVSDSAASAGTGDSSDQAVTGEVSSDTTLAAAEQPAQTEGHAPMEHADKTNTSVTLFVIAGVILVGGGVLLIMRKKGLL